MFSPASLISKSLARVVAEGIAKPMQRADAVAAWLAAVSLAEVDESADKTLEAEGVWKETSKESALLSASAAGRLPLDEAECAAQLAERLLIAVRLYSPRWIDLPISQSYWQKRCMHQRHSV